MLFKEDMTKQEMKKSKKSGFGILKGIGPFTKEDELISCLVDKEEKKKTS